MFDEDHESFRKTFRAFLESEVVPHFDEWYAAGIVPREVYHQLAELGIFGIEVPEEYGGAGLETFKYEAVLLEETARAGISLGGSGVHVMLCLHYILGLATAEQKERWLPPFVAADEMWAIAMTEPGTGSDLAGMRTTAKLLLVVDTKSPGYAVGRKLDKLGLKVSDTAELSFTDVQVPVENLLGEEGQGFSYLGANLPRERLGIAIGAYAQAAAAVRFALEYARGAGCWRTHAGRSSFRQALLHRGRAPGHRPVSAVARRLWLHERVPNRAALRRQPGEPHLRRDLRGHEGVDRQGHGPVTGSHPSRGLARTAVVRQSWRLWRPRQLSSSSAQPVI